MRMARRGTTSCRASTYSAWQSPTHNDQSEGGAKAIQAVRDNGVTRVFKHVDGSMSPPEGSDRFRAIW